MSFAILVQTFLRITIKNSRGLFSKLSISVATSLYARVLNSINENVASGRYVQNMRLCIILSSVLLATNANT